MKTYTEEDGWYGDCTLEGDWTSLHRDSHIVQNGNRIELCPDGNVLQLVTKGWGNQVLIAGQGQKQGSGCWLYIDGKWTEITTSFGTFCCAFGTDDLYCVSGPNQYRIYDLVLRTLGPVINRSIGVNGIRYIDFNQSPDGIVTGDQSYGPVPYNISQWNLRGNIVIGQSYDNDKLIAKVLGKETYLLNPLNNKFIRFYRQGNNLAICSVRQEQFQTDFYWMTVDELLNGWTGPDGKHHSFPVYTPPIDKPKEEPKPEEPKVPELAQPPNKIETVKRMLRLHPEVDLKDKESQTGRAKIVDYTIKAEGGKPWGRKARNKDGSNKNSDGLTWLIPNDPEERFYIIDILIGINPTDTIDPDRAKYANWDVHGPFKPGENGWWAPGNPINSDEPKEEPKDEPKEEPKVEFEHPTWDQLRALVEKMNEANKNTKLAKVIPIVADRDLYPIMTTAHMVWGFLIEGRTVEDIVQDVIKRGNDEK